MISKNSTCLTIIGAGGHGKEMADIAILTGYDTVQFMDDDFPKRVKHYGWPLIGPLNDGVSGPFFVAVGDNATRRLIVMQLADDRGELVSLIHPSATVSSTANISSGVAIMAGANISSDVSIGQGAIINALANVSHNCTVAPFAQLSPATVLSGSVSIGENGWLGSGAIVQPGLSVGDGAIVAAGSVVTKDVSPGTLVSGIPARVKSG